MILFAVTDALANIISKSSKSSVIGSCEVFGTEKTTFEISSEERVRL